ncbi:fatty acid desaturase family protein [Aidingimonas halophila]|uniref:Fatty acid desaturase n=1 Tax=Aidingimonas halophila TaxID=574349 RepID=A0A1H2ZCC8_9GAMM|nr:fatty acid desaturase family protein [Aidingimonas halophila]GHC15757.1 fatty acid desaturase [Aidingimonas halophila]SDX15040.1 Fatty acid desaturase [Aidingimonas halophila]
MSPQSRDYRLTGPEAEKAAQKGLISAEWYQAPIPRKRLKQLIRRKDGPGIRLNLLWLACLAGLGLAAYLALGTAWSVLFFVLYGVMYGSAADSRWHECGHGTMFKTRWLNDVVYQLASFMMMREPQVWRWSHARHHTDTIIVGHDPEILAERPPKLGEMLLGLLTVPQTLKAIHGLLYHACGRLTAEEATFIPEMERGRIFLTARIWLLIHACMVGYAIHLSSIVPLLYVGILPTMYGGWLSYLLGITQHVGLEEDTLDHRANSRTIYMNPVLRFIYSNMNYHLEHHMYPMVPFHALPTLHEELKPYTPPAYPSTWAAYREIIPTLLHQCKDPDYCAKRPVGDVSTNETAAATSTLRPNSR